MRHLALSSAVRGVSLIAGFATRARLSILIFHRVLPEYDPLRPNEPTEAEFAQQMSVLRQYFQPLPLLEAVERLREGSLPPRSVCVTFDDGYADNAEYALPVLKRYAIPATIFVATGFLNGGRMFNDTVIETVRGVQGERLDLRPFDLDDYPVATTADRLAAIAEILNTIKHLQPDRREAVTGAIESFAESLPDNLMMTDEQVRSLVNNGLEVGAHTVHHPILASVDAQTALQEISTCKAQLEALLQREVLSFAYPNGRPGIDYRQEHRDMVSSCGFRTAVATHWGAAVASSDPYQLPRFTPWDTQPARYAARLLLNYRRGDSLVA